MPTLTSRRRVSELTQPLIRSNCDSPRTQYGIGRLYDEGKNSVNPVTPPVTGLRTLHRRRSHDGSRIGLAHLWPVHGQNGSGLNSELSCAFRRSRRADSEAQHHPVVRENDHSLHSSMISDLLSAVSANRSAAEAWRADAFVLSRLPGEFLESAAPTRNAGGRVSQPANASAAESIWDEEAFVDSSAAGGESDRRSAAHSNLVHFPGGRHHGRFLVEAGGGDEASFAFDPEPALPAPSSTGSAMAAMAMGGSSLAHRSSVSAGLISSSVNGSEAHQPLSAVRGAFQDPGGSAPSAPRSAVDSVDFDTTGPPVAADNFPETYPRKDSLAVVGAASLLSSIGRGTESLLLTAAAARGIPVPPGSTPQYIDAHGGSSHSPTPHNEIERNGEVDSSEPWAEAPVTEQKDQSCGGPYFRAIKVQDERTQQETNSEMCLDRDGPLKCLARVHSTKLRRKPLVVLSISQGQCRRMEFGTSELLKIVHMHRPTCATGLGSDGHFLSGTLKLRDLRQICSPGPGSQRPSIEPRRSCILVNMPYVKALILRTGIFLLARSGPRDVLPGVDDEEVAAQFSKPLMPDLELDGSDTQKAGIVQKLVRVSEMHKVAPFEFLALESILFEVISQMSDALAPIQALTQRVQCQQTYVLSSTTKLHEIRETKRLLQEIVGIAKGVSKSLYEILENEEDLRRLEISRFWEHPQEWDEPSDSPGAEDVEILLESYQQDVDSLLHEIGAMDETLDTLLQIMQLHLATTRNNLLKLEISLQVVSVVIAVVAAIAGIFGMNIPNGYEHDKTFFWELFRIMGWTIFGVFGAAFLLTLRLKL